MRAVRVLLAISASLLPTLPGCVLTTASLQGLGGTRYPAQRAYIDASRPALVVEELAGERRRAVRPLDAPPRTEPSSRVLGGPVRSTCACFRSAYGLAEHYEGLPWRAQLQDQDGTWVNIGAEVRPFEDRSVPGTVLALCLLPLTLGVDLALLPLEVIFVLSRD